MSSMSHRSATTAFLSCVIPSFTPSPDTSPIWIRAHFISVALNRSLVRLCLLDEPDNLKQCERGTREVRRGTCDKKYYEKG